jgi:hypothetical protein
VAQRRRSAEEVETAGEAVATFIRLLLVETSIWG